MIRRPPRSTRTDPLVPYTTRFRSAVGRGGASAISPPCPCPTSFTVSAARRMALSDSSLAWAKPVHSPFRPRRPKPCCVSKLAFLSRPSSTPKHFDTPYCRSHIPETRRVGQESVSPFKNRSAPHHY